MNDGAGYSAGQLFGGSSDIDNPGMLRDHIFISVIIFLFFRGAVPSSTERNNDDLLLVESDIFGFKEPQLQQHENRAHDEKNRRGELNHNQCFR